MPRIKRICLCNVCRGKRQPIDSRKAASHLALYGHYCAEESHPKSDAKKDKTYCIDDGNASSDSEAEDPFTNGSNALKLKRKNNSRLDKAGQKKSKW